MTGYTVHTGSTEKFSNGWDTIFKNKKKTAQKTAAKKTSGKRAKKKRSGKK